MEKYYDVTVPIEEGVAVYEGDPPISVETYSSLKRGDPYNLLELSFSSHTGTHIDAPYHFFKTGKGVDKIPFDVLIGPAKVVLLRGKQSISKKDLQDLNLRGTERILFKTDHSFLRDRYRRFRSNYVYLEVDACGYLVDIGVKLVGIDSFSIEEYGRADFLGHKILLGAGIVIVEMVDLREVEAGEYDLICLPLRITDGDGAPARVVLKKKEFSFKLHHL